MKRAGGNLKNQRRTDQGVATDVSSPRVLPRVSCESKGMPRRLREGDLCVLPAFLTSFVQMCSELKAIVCSMVPKSHVTDFTKPFAPKETLSCTMLLPTSPLRWKRLVQSGGRGKMVRCADLPH